MKFMESIVFMNLYIQNDHQTIESIIRYFYAQIFHKSKNFQFS